jgi:hypothetical protein
MAGMTGDTQEIDWNELRVGDVQVRPNGDTRTVTDVSELPGGGINWVSFDGGPNLGDGGRVTIRARNEQ